MHSVTTDMMQPLIDSQPHDDATPLLNDDVLVRRHARAHAAVPRQRHQPLALDVDVAVDAISYVTAARTRSRGQALGSGAVSRVLHAHDAPRAGASARDAEAAETARALPWRRVIASNGR